MTRPDIGTRLTARLVLREPRPDDLPFLTDLFARPELVAHRPNPKPDGSAESAAHLRGMIDHWREMGFGRWTIERDGDPIGFGGLTRKAEAVGLNLSYHLHPKTWGQGYVAEMVEEALVVAFSVLRAPAVSGLVRPVNVASRRVLERAGFVVDAEIMLDGAPSIRLVKTAPQ